MKRRVLSLVSLLCLLAAGVSFGADDQQFTISRATNKWNIYPQALALPNGNVLVTWNERSNSTNEVAWQYTVLCVRNAKGQFSAKAPVLASTGNQFDDDGHIAYNPQNNTVMMVFYTLRRMADCSSVPDLRTRLLNDSGKPIAQVNKVTAVNESDFAAFLVYVGNGNRTYLLMWERDSRYHKDSGQVGLWSAFLDADGNMVTNPKRFYARAYEDGTTSTYYPGYIMDAVVNKDKTFTVAVTHYFDEGSNPQDGALYRMEAYLYRLNKEGGFAKRNALGTTGDSVRASIAKLTKNLYLVGWSDLNTEDFGYYTRKFRLSLSPKGQAEKMLPERETLYGAPVKLSEDPGSYLLYVSQGQLWGQYVKKNGKLVGDPQYLAKGFGSMDEMSAVPVTGSNQIFIAWRKRTSNLTTEIWGVVVDPLKD